MKHDRVADDGFALANSLAFSATVHQATGMVSVQAMRSADGALSLLCGYAASVGSSVEAVARDVVFLRIRFDATGYARRLPTVEPG
jgi:hypothetical protein